MSEKIFLTYTNATAVPYQGSVLGYHVVLNYIDSNGRHHTLQGVPEGKFGRNIDKLVAAGREEIFSDGVSNRDSPFQRLQAERGEGREASQPHTMVAEGDDLSSRWALMEGFADEVNSIGYEYRPVSQNSNSFAGGALQRAGFFGPGTEFPERFDRQLVFDPVRGETRSLSVPGFEKPLANPINTATPMPFPLSELVAPVVPTHGFPAPNRRNSFDGRFGDSRAAPERPASNTRSPVLRELEKYRRSAAPDGPAPISVQGKDVRAGRRPPPRCWEHSAASRYCRFRMRYGACRIDPAHLPAAPCPIFWLVLPGEIQQRFRRMTNRADLIATARRRPGSSKGSARGDRPPPSCRRLRAFSSATFQHI